MRQKLRLWSICLIAFLFSSTCSLHAQFWGCWGGWNNPPIDGITQQCVSTQAQTVTFAISTSWTVYLSTYYSSHGAGHSLTNDYSPWITGVPSTGQGNFVVSIPANTAHTARIAQ